MTFENKRLTAIIAGVALLLLVPFIAMQFSNEVNWSGFDFMIAGLILVGAGGLVELVLRKVKSTKKRLLLAGIILLLLLTVWAELAVGIFGTPVAGS